MSRRYPLDALVTASGLTEAALGRKVGLSGTTLKRAREEGLVEKAADRYAVRAGLHPHNVWPDMAEHAIADAEQRERERRERRRESWRRYAAKVRADEERYAAKRQAENAYYRECGEYVRARERRRYWSDPERARAAARERRRQRREGTAA